eukprot:TRINITY_DN1200_c0_g1_i1.p1 TRINITY_DN1200_c0_g1~~TRINITY_DN1200_c0_g1_i1.p1  ORF type:complete len:493 (+),score=247.00 TRINITY_DN1200_c0_g1_i1:72-1481(+)
MNPDKNQCFKIVFGDEIRRISFASAPAWDEFQKAVEKILSGKLQIASANIQYQDEEGDLINISSEMEWNEAVDVLAPSKLKRITVTRKATKSAVKSAPKKIAISEKKEKLAEPIPESLPEEKREIIAEPVAPIPTTFSAPQVSVPEAESCSESSEMFDLMALNQEVKHRIDSFVGEFQKAMPYIVAEGCQMKKDLHRTLSAALIEGNSTGMALIRGGSDSVQAAYNQFITQLNIILPMIINGGLPMLKNFSVMMLRQIKDGSNKASMALASIDIFDKLNISQTLNKLATLLMRHQKLEEARRVLEVVVDRYPTNAIGYYNLACAQCLTGDLDKGLSSLDSAVQAGFKDIGKIETDPDLEAIRDREEFGAILALLKHEEESAQSAQDLAKELDEFHIIDKSASQMISALPRIAPSIVPREESGVAEAELTRYAEELKMLNDMGFGENQVNLRLLIAEKGDVSAVISALLQ